VDFEAISSAIGVAPSKVVRKGSLSKIGKKQELDTWIFESQLPEHEPLESHVRWFAKTLPNADGIKNLRLLQGVEDVDVFCAVSADSTTCSISLPADVLNACARMALDLEISLVFGNVQVVSDMADQRMEVNLDSPKSGFREQSSAALLGRLLPDTQTILRDVAQRSSGASSMIQALSDQLEIEFNVAFRTTMAKDKSPESQLRKLEEALRGHIHDLKRFGDAASFSIESRFETDCEWASTRLSWQAFNLPVLLDCPLILEAVLL
jgi:hypothetical protein